MGPVRPTYRAIGTHALTTLCRRLHAKHLVLGNEQRYPHQHFYQELNRVNLPKRTRDLSGANVQRPVHEPGAREASVQFARTDVEMRSWIGYLALSDEKDGHRRAAPNATALHFDSTLLNVGIWSK